MKCFNDAIKFSLKHIFPLFPLFQGKVKYQQNFILPSFSVDSSLVVFLNYLFSLAIIECNIILTIPAKGSL